MRADQLIDPLQASVAMGSTQRQTPVLAKSTDTTGPGARDPAAYEWRTKEDAVYVPSETMICAMCDTLLDDSSNPKETHEIRSGCVRIKESLSSLFRSYTSALGECGDTSCGCYRLKGPEGRRRFRRLVAQRTEEALRASATLMGDLSTSPAGVRMVTIGSGGLLTDFEILLDLRCRGIPIESVVAIDTDYKADIANCHREGGSHADALSSLAVFFAPARVVAFSSNEDYIAACEKNPARYGQANVFVYCDAAAVPHEAFLRCASAALLPGHRAFELTNAGRFSSRRAEALDHYLPAHLQSTHTTQGSCTMRSMRLSANPRSGRHSLEDVDDPMIALGERSQPHSLYTEAVEYLKQHCRERALANPGHRVFRVVYKGTGQEKPGVPPRMPVRAEPSRSAQVIGSRKQGDEVLADTVTDDGWIKMSLLDTYAGYEAAPHGGHGDDGNTKVEPREMWMLIRAPESHIGELLREITLDGDGMDVDGAEWAPAVF